jgi:thiol-disulfide isomerase/thioredoxin
VEGAHSRAPGLIGGGAVIDRTETDAFSVESEHFPPGRVSRENDGMRRFVIFVSLGIASLVLGTACHHETAQPAAQKKKPAIAKAAAPAEPVDPTAVGSAMPDFSAKLLDGKTFDVKEHRGKVVLLNLWATWCGPCRAEIPELLALSSKHAVNGLEIVGVSLDDASAESAVRDFAKEQKISYPIALDPDGKLANDFRTSVIPTTVLVDRAGTIRWRRIGAIEKNDKELDSAIAKAIAAKS